MITHGTSADWSAWALMLATSLIAAYLCYRQGRLVGSSDGERMNATYAALMGGFLFSAFLEFLHAPFHVG